MMIDLFYSWWFYPIFFAMYRSRFSLARFRFKGFLISSFSVQTAHKTTFFRILRYMKDAPWVITDSHAAFCVFHMT